MGVFGIDNNMIEINNDKNIKIFDQSLINITLKVG